MSRFLEEVASSGSRKVAMQIGTHSWDADAHWIARHAGKTHWYLDEGFWSDSLIFVKGAF